MLAPFNHPPRQRLATSQRVNQFRWRRTDRLEKPEREQTRSRRPFNGHRDRGTAGRYTGAHHQHDIIDAICLRTRLSGRRRRCRMLLPRTEIETIEKPLGTPRHNRRIGDGLLAQACQSYRSSSSTEGIGIEPLPGSVVAHRDQQLEPTVASQHSCRWRACPGRLSNVCRQSCSLPWPGAGRSSSPSCQLQLVVGLLHIEPGRCP
jgi:hypothetical protein